MTQNRSNEELHMRELIVPILRDRYPSARIIHELPLRYSTNRIDLAAVTETEIVSVEIKSSRDVADRLEKQVREFLPVSSRVIVALAPKWNEKLPMLKIEREGATIYSPQYTPAQEIIERIGSAYIETWTVSADPEWVDAPDRFMRQQMPWPARMLDMLHVSELVAIAGRHRCWAGKRPVHLDLVRACNEFMTAREITKAVCAALRARNAFAAGTDAPIGVAA